MKGPIDYLIVKFKDHEFDGSILTELQKASEDGAISVLDVLVIAKDSDGNVASEEIKDSSFAKSTGMIGADDVDEVGDLLENGESAGLLIIEQLWAKGLKKALLDADATLVSEGRIHPEAAKELN